jgi:hypothetical protein
VQKVAGSNPSCGGEATFRSDFVVDCARKQYVSAHGGCLSAVYPDNTLSAPRPVRKGWVGAIQILTKMYFSHCVIVQNEWLWKNKKNGSVYCGRSLVYPITASCENVMTLSVPGAPASCEKFPHSSQLNF